MFFVIGKQAGCALGRIEENISFVHEVAMNQYRHRTHPRPGSPQADGDLRQAMKRTEGASGCSTRLFSLPYGILNLASWGEAGRQGWERVLWARWGKDTRQWGTPEPIAGECGRLEAGDILMLHEPDRCAARGSSRNTLGALPGNLERLSIREQQVLPRGDLLERNGC